MLTCGTRDEDSRLLKMRLVYPLFKAPHINNGLKLQTFSEDLRRLIDLKTRTHFGFYTVDGHSFILSVFLLPHQYSDSDVITKIWSANLENPVSHGATLNFTREGDLLLHDGDATMIWSTVTKRMSVVSMGLDVSGNLVLLDQNNSSVWQSFDHPTDTLVMGQSLCIGMSLSAKPTNTKWASDRVYLSAVSYGLQYSFKPAAYMHSFVKTTTATTSTPLTCYKFVNASFGFPDTIFSFPPAKLLQFMRLESDGHLRLYEMQEFGSYELDEQHPDAGCTPLTSISCDHVHSHQLRIN
ncbi:hypothetical protein EJB05_10573, partial [Eragrostis curvula]